MALQAVMGEGKLCHREPRERDMRRFAFTLLLSAAVFSPTGGVAQEPPPSDPTLALPDAFVRRSARKGGGRFYTAADIEKMRANATPQLLARISGGDLRDVGGGETALVSRRGNRNSFGASVENALCRIGLVVNERLMPDGFDLRSIAVPAIVAIEFYSGPSTVPPDLNATGDAGACGLIVVWVKGGA